MKIWKGAGIGDTFETIEIGAAIAICLVLVVVLIMLGVNVLWESFTREVWKTCTRENRKGEKMTRQIYVNKHMTLKQVAELAGGKALEEFAALAPEACPAKVEAVPPTTRGNAVSYKVDEEKSTGIPSVDLAIHDMTRDDTE